VKRHVLLIDDDVLCMRWYLEALKEEDFEAYQVRDPDAAIEYLSNTHTLRPDVIVLDIMLPPGQRYRGRPDCRGGLDTGILLYEEIRKICTDVPVIFLTSVLNPSTLSALRPKAAVYDKSDLAPFELASVLRRVLGEEDRTCGDH
jgi:CheY-like chemotaxis protein